MYKYRLYIDESGDHSYKHADDLFFRYLGLTGVLIEKKAYDLMFQPCLEGLKRIYFSPDIDRTIILVRQEIRGQDGVFKVLLDPVVSSRWEYSILNYFASLISYAQIFTVVIDKKQHLGKYTNEPFDPYAYNLEVLLWRVRGYLVPSRPQAEQVDVIAESRGETEDKRLKEVYRKLRTDGPQNKQWGTAEGYREAFPAEELIVRKKSANVAGLQIADLVAAGQKLETLDKGGKPLQKPMTDFTKQLNSTIAPMINEFGRYLMK